MKCVICKKPYQSMGHNAQPVKDGRCCTDCNDIHVIPARVAMAYPRKEKDMSKEQMKRDIGRHTRDKLKTLVADTLDLYQTAGLPLSESLATLASEMAHMMVLLLVDTTMSPKKFGALMEQTFAEFRAEKKGHGHEEVQVIEIELLHPNVRHDVFGILPEFLDQNDPRPAREQFNERYAHGGGWSPSKGWQLLKDDSIYYSKSVEEGEDPRHPPLARIKFRDESIVIYDHAWVAIIQKDRSFEVSRMD
jgi:hypothetical protein